MENKDTIVWTVIICLGQDTNEKEKFKKQLKNQEITIDDFPFVGQMLFLSKDKLLLEEVKKLIECQHSINDIISMKEKQ